MSASDWRTSHRGDLSLKDAVWVGVSNELNLTPSLDLRQVSFAHVNLQPHMRWVGQYEEGVGSRAKLFRAQFLTRVETPFDDDSADARSDGKALVHRLGAPLEPGSGLSAIEFRLRTQHIGFCLL